MLMPSRWDWRMRAYMSTVSILGSFQAEQLRSRSSACGAGYGGSILPADLTGGGGSLLRADYHICAEFVPAVLRLHMQTDLHGVLVEFLAFFHPDRRRLHHEPVITSLLRREFETEGRDLFAVDPAGLLEFLQLLRQVFYLAVGQAHEHFRRLRSVKKLMLERMAELGDEGNLVAFLCHRPVRQQHVAMGGRGRSEQSRGHECQAESKHGSLAVKVGNDTRRIMLRPTGHMGKAAVAEQHPSSPMVYERSKYQ